MMRQPWPAHRYIHVSDHSLHLACSRRGTGSFGQHNGAGCGALRRSFSHPFAREVSSSVFGSLFHDMKYCIHDYKRTWSFHIIYLAFSMPALASLCLIRVVFGYTTTTSSSGSCNCSSSSSSSGGIGAMSVALQSTFCPLMYLVIIHNPWPTHTD